MGTHYEEYNVCRYRTHYEEYNVVVCRLMIARSIVFSIMEFVTEVITVWWRVNVL